jgi:Mrp family chromosome partitioning ATPase/capsular polysaccharide biosynthesis protein
MEPQTTAQPRLADYIRPLTSRWWLIVVAVAVATGGVYAIYRRQPNVYSTSTLVYYHDPGDPVTGIPSLASTDRTVANEATLLYSIATADAVAKRIRYQGTPEELLGHVSLTSKPGEDFVQISAQAGDAREAARIANGFAQQLTSSLNGQVELRIANALKLSQAQLAQRPQSQTGDVQSTNLADQVNRLQLALKVPSTVATQVQPALPPGAPSSPKPVRNALFAFILSLVGAVAVAYGLERFDRRLKNPDEMERAYERPLLAVLPHTTDPAPVRDDGPSLGPDFREPFRVLRTNVELASVDTPPRTIVVSSAMPGEGKSTVARNLALAFRESGKTVAIVDLDLRHPALGPMFGVPLGPGVTDVLRHGAELDEAAHEIPVALPVFEESMREVSQGAVTSPTGTVNGWNGSGAFDTKVTVLLSGGQPANPPAVLASDRLLEVLDELREQHDVVLIDSAPVLAVSDTVPLLRYADAALFVGRLEVTTRDTAKRLMEFLTRIPDVNFLGVVANDLSRHEAGAYGYGYGYRGYYHESGRKRRKAAKAEQAV